MRIGVFAYNFPHKKTQDFLFRLFVEKANVVVVLAADPVELHIPPGVIRTKPRFAGLVHPRVICERFGWRYEVVEHGSPETARMLQELQVQVGIIAGARILKAPVISAVQLGIINFHPGLLPEVRGLDALQWALYEGHALGITAHAIDERVDAGRIVLRREIKLYPDDTLIDVSMRLQEIQTEMLPDVLQILQNGIADLQPVGKSQLHRKMPAELELQIPELLKARLSQLTSKKT